jgi:hypothetical protein
VTDALEILFCPTGRGRWRALVLRRPRGIVIEGLNTLGAAFDLDEPDFGAFEMVNPRVGYHRRELPDGTIRVSFSLTDVDAAVEWLQRAVVGRFERVG